MFDAIKNISDSSLRGFQDTKAAVIFNLCGLIALSLAGYFLGNTASLGADGIYAGRGMGLFIAAALSTLRWYMFSNQAIQNGAIPSAAVDTIESEEAVQMTHWQMFKEKICCRSISSDIASHSLSV